MKKFFMVVVAVCLAAVMAAPVMAVDVDLSGHLRVRGHFMENNGLDADAPESKARYDMRFRLRSVFKVNDMVRITTRFDAFDGYRFGSAGGYDDTGAAADTQIDLDRIYMTIVSDFGKFDIGRQGGGGWGLAFGDYVGDYDRIKYTLAQDDYVVGGIIQKNVELDWQTAGTVDNDLDVYYLFGVYKGFDNITLGLLYAYVDYDQVATQHTTKHAFLPYFVGKWDPFSLQAEFIWETGDRDFDAPAVPSSVDLQTLTWNIEGAYTSGALGAEIGYASQSGQDPNDVDLTAGNTAYGGIGEDWDKFVIFGDADQLLNLSGTTPVTTTGVNLWYVGVSFQATEDVKVWFNLGGASADEDQGWADDEYGTEFDANVSWNLMDNLTYTVRAGLLEAGDIWKNINGLTNVDDTMTIYHKLQVTF